MDHLLVDKEVVYIAGLGIINNCRGGLSGERLLAEMTARFFYRKSLLDASNGLFSRQNT